MGLHNGLDHDAAHQRQRHEHLYGEQPPRNDDDDMGDAEPAGAADAEADADADAAAATAAAADDDGAADQYPAAAANDNNNADDDDAENLAHDDENGYTHSHSASSARGSSASRRTVQFDSSGSQTVLSAAAHLPVIDCVGYRDSRTGKIYVNMPTQTPTALELRQKLAQKYHRETQTKDTRNRTAQSTRDCAVQVNHQEANSEKAAKYKTIAPKEYCTSEIYHERYLRCIVKLQCFFRRLLAIRKVSRRRELHEAKKRITAEKLRKKEELLVYERQREVDRREHPKSSRDFALLYSGLERWRQAESAKIKNSNLSAHEKAVSYKSLLVQEAAMIQQLCTLKTQASEEAQKKRTLDWVNQVATPKKWVNEHGTSMSVDTPSTVRAQELRDMYMELVEVPQDSEQRLATLLRVKNVVKEFDCNLSLNIVQLINREGDLICRGRDGFFLEGLRQRINTYFLQFIGTPNFNPEILCASAEKATLKDAKSHKTYKCKLCLMHLPSTKFPLTTQSCNVHTCSQCLLRKSEGCDRSSKDQYERMLGIIRCNEAMYSTTSYIAKFMTIDDIRVIVEVVWGSRSAISGTCSDISKLVLVRWDIETQLSPWNAIVLTLNEARVHSACTDPSVLYCNEFVDHVKSKLEFSKSKFSQLFAFVHEIERDPSLLRRLTKKIFENRLAPTPDVTV